jgi:hypothetical protein
VTQAAPAAIERTSGDATLALRSLSVRRMPGFTSGGFDFADLSPGINLIHGPNGSGKSTTARAIRGLLWPGHDLAKNASIAGQFAWDGSAWSIDFDAGRVEHRLRRRPGERTTRWARRTARDAAAATAPGS